jgi:CRP-like cAMP-binding protein
MCHIEDGEMHMKNYLEILEKEDIVSKENFDCLEFVHFDKNDRLLTEGEELEYVYILLKGRVRTMHSTKNGAMNLNAISKPISVYGQVEFMNGQLVNHDVIALSPCLCLRFDVEKYGSRFMNDVAFMRYVAKSLANISYNLANNAAISINFPVENRLASYFMSVEQNGMVHENFVQVAQMIGSSYRQVQRVLKSFIERGYIVKVKRGVYQIKNPDALKDLDMESYRFIG